jgi:hypothetical protein
MIIKFDKYINEKLDYNEYKSLLVDNYGDEERGKEEFDYYNKLITDYQDNGCDLYRLVFLNDITELNTKEIGNHWTFNKDEINRYYNNIVVDDDKKQIPFLITGYFKPNSIDLETSWKNFSILPDESEIYTTKQPSSYKVEKYYHN